jgi:hypothetical protein
MSEIRIHGNVSVARLKALDSALAPKAKQQLEAKPDGFDTYGLKTEAGDQLLVTTSRKPLKTNDVVTIGGKQAQISFVENEAHTFGERFEAAFKTTGVRIALAAGGLLALAPMGLATNLHPAVFVAGLACSAAFGVLGMASIMSPFIAAEAGLTKVKTDESVTDALAPK